MESELEKEKEFSPNDERNLIDAIKDTIKGNFIEKEEKEKRIDICRAPCEFLEPILKLNCTRCGCLIDWKSSLEKEKCPESKW